MRIAVTGAGGFVGHAVAAALQERGHEVVALVRRPHLGLDGAEQRLVDIVDTSAVVGVLSDVDAVCHLAALGRVRESRSDPLSYWRTNVGGTLSVLAAAAELPRLRRVVLASSASVYVDSDRPLTEDAPVGPGHPYGATKLAADLAARDTAETGGIGAVSLRAFNIAGAWDDRYDADESRLIPKTLAVAAGRADALTVNGDGTAVRDFVHVRDMADAFVRALDACHPGRWRAYNIGGGTGASVADVIASAERVSSASVTTRRREPAPEPTRLLADSTRAQTELGWRAKRSSLDHIIGDAWTALTRQYARGEYSSSD